MLNRSPPGMRALLLGCLVGLCTSCAMGNANRRLLLNAMDRNLTPESEVARWALAPVGLPAALGGLAIDAVIVHPVTQFDEAWSDTTELLWSRSDETALRRAMMTPISALATPLVYAGSWLGRSVFDIDDWQEEDT